MAKKRILKELEITAIAAVDRPAQEHALSAILKRSSSVVTEAIAKQWINPQDGAVEFSAYMEQQAKTENFYEQMEEFRPLLNALDNALSSIIADAGLDLASKSSAMENSINDFLTTVSGIMSASQTEKIKNSVEKFRGKFKGKKGTDHMTETLEKKVTDLKTTVTDLTAKLAKAEANWADAEVIAKMSDKEKAFMAGIKDEEEKTKFKAMTPEDRAKKIGKAAEAEETVTVAGQTIAKSVVGEAHFAIFKAQAEEAETLRKSNEENTVKIAKAHFEADAVAKFPNLKGTVEERGAILKAVDAMPEDVKKSVLEMMTAHNDLIAKATTTLGVNVTETSAEGKTAVTVFKSKVSEIAKRDNLQNHEAMAKARDEFPKEFEAYNKAS